MGKVEKSQKQLPIEEKKIFKNYYYFAYSYQLTYLQLDNFVPGYFRFYK